MCLFTFVWSFLAPPLWYLARLPRVFVPAGLRNCGAVGPRARGVYRVEVGGHSARTAQVRRGGTGRLLIKLVNIERVGRGTGVFLVANACVGGLVISLGVAYSCTSPSFSAVSSLLRLLLWIAWKLSVSVLSFVFALQTLFGSTFCFSIFQ